MDQKYLRGNINLGSYKWSQPQYKVFLSNHFNGISCRTLELAEFPFLETEVLLYDTLLLHQDCLLETLSTGEESN